MVRFFASLILLCFAVAESQAQVASSSPTSSVAAQASPSVSSSPTRFELLRKAFDQLSPEQQEKVRTMDRAVRSAVAEQAGHARGVRIVVLQPLLAPKGVADGGFQFGGESQDFVARIPAALAAEDGHRLSVVD